MNLQVPWKVGNILSSWVTFRWQVERVIQVIDWLIIICLVTVNKTHIELFLFIITVLRSCYICTEPDLKSVRWFLGMWCFTTEVIISWNPILMVWNAKVVFFLRPFRTDFGERLWSSLQPLYFTLPPSLRFHHFYFIAICWWGEEPSEIEDTTALIPKLLIVHDSEPFSTVGILTNCFPSISFNNIFLSLWLSSKWLLFKGFHVIILYIFLVSSFELHAP